MLRLALCDDEAIALSGLAALVERYRLEHGVELSYTAYRSPLELMAVMDQGRRWDVLLLDIMMPGENGMELAEEIRTLDEDVKIIFLTSAPEYALASYRVHAFDYLLKPVPEEQLFRALDRAAADLQQNKREKIVFRGMEGISAVDAAEVLYCEVMGRTLTLHLTGGRVLEGRGRMEEMEKQLLPLGGFCRAHRSYLVNLARVQSLTYRAVTLEGGAEIPIPHGKFSEIKQAYLDYAFEKP